MREIWVCWEDPWEEKATHSSGFGLGNVESMGLKKESDMTGATFTFTLAYNPKGIHFRRKPWDKIDEPLKSLNLTSNNLDLWWDKDNDS